MANSTGSECVLPTTLLQLRHAVYQTPVEFVYDLKCSFSSPARSAGDINSIYLHSHAGCQEVVYQPKPDTMAMIIVG
jgi:hypothetical protein